MLPLREISDVIILTVRPGGILKTRDDPAKRENFMNEITKWLIDVERLVGGFYESAAWAFKGDVKLTDFLRHLAEEETGHSQVLERAVEYLEGRPDIISAITVDEATMARIEAPFHDYKRKLETGELGRDAVIESMALAEFSEWNDVFLYVMNILKEGVPEFRTIAAKMQTHKQHIEAFLESLPGGGNWHEMICRIPPVWEPHILIVEDHEPIAEFLNTYLGREGTVATAVNGNEGLQKVKERYFDIILTDLDMPGMNGIALYLAAEQLYPGIRNRFLFMAGNPSDEDIAFFKDRRLPYMIKPMLLDEITTSVHAILDSLPHPKSKTA